MSTLKIFILMILQPTLHAYPYEVVWTPKTQPVVFGDSLELFCNTTRSHCNNCTKHWYGGYNKDGLISFNEKTVDPDKYVVTMEKEDGFGLTIKNLTEKDVYVTYSCSNGFDTFKENLTLDDSYEYHPKNETMKVKVNVINGTMLHTVLEFKKVHPIPLCEAKLDEEDLTHKLTVNSSKKDLFYSVVVELHHEPKTQNGKLMLPCSIGTRKTMFVEQDLKFTNEEDQQDFIVLYVLAGVVCIGVTIFVALFTYRAHICKKLKYAKGEKDEKDATRNVTPGDENVTFLDSNGAEKDRKGYSV